MPGSIKHAENDFGHVHAPALIILISLNTFYKPCALAKKYPVSLRRRKRSLLQSFQTEEVLNLKLFYARSNINYHLDKNIKRLKKKEIKKNAQIKLIT